MSTINISDITPAGAFANAVMTARDSDCRIADRHVESGEGSSAIGSLKTLARRIATAITGIRRTTSPLTSRPV